MSEYAEGFFFGFTVCALLVLTAAAMALIRRRAIIERDTSEALRRLLQRK